MRTLKRNWKKLASVLTLAGLALCVGYACISTWGQSAPGLSISSTGAGAVVVTITNGSSNAFYQLYYREFPTTNYPWIYVTNGAVNQTNFLFNTGDTVSGYFEASYNPSFVPPTITVIIQSPANGATIY